MKSVCILLVLITCVYHDVQIKKVQLPTNLLSFITEVSFIL
jgi:hypothetical protein